MQGSINTTLASTAKAEATAFLEQAERFYSAAVTGISTNPLLLYYAYLNLAKALIRVRGYGGSLDRAMHGLTESVAAGGLELLDSVVTAKDRPGLHGTLNIYPELVERLGYARPANGAAYPVRELLPQVVVGHRIWREARAGHTERFFDLKDIEIVNEPSAKQLWLRLYVDRGDLERYRISHSRLITEGGLVDAFHEVDVRATQQPHSLLCYEQMDPVSYTGRPTDVVNDLVWLVRSRLWRVVSAVPASGYRRYYIHLTPPAETHRVAQLESLWLLSYYLGSVVRYRPHKFTQLLTGEYGAFLVEFVSSQPDQMLYLMASEICQREIARPAIV